MEASAKNFAIWMAMQSSCEFFTTEMAYYGGGKRFPKDNADLTVFCNKHKIEKFCGHYPQEQIKSVILNIGINFEKSSNPVSTQCGLFVGTFQDNEMIDIVYGALVLKDGGHIDYCATCSINVEMFEDIQKFFQFAKEHQNVKSS